MKLILRALVTTLCALVPLTAVAQIGAGGSITANQGTSGSQGWLVQGLVAHDAVYSGNPLPTGCYASASAPSDVSADGDMVRMWCLRNGALSVNLTNTSIAATQSGPWNITNISGTVSLPTGAATAVKQPALGTAGSASADVITVQGITSMTPLLVNGSGVTQPVNGTVTANAGTDLNTSALALETGGNLAAAATVLGTTADAAAGDATATINAHVRQIAKLFSAVAFGDINNVASASGLLNVIPAARYDSTQPTLTNGRWSSFQLSSRGELFIAKGVGGFSIDNTSFAATQAGNWNSRTQDGAGNALTTNSSTYTAKFALDGNWLGTLGTAFSTPGKVDVKSADGDMATLGTKTDAKSTATDTTSVSAISVLKQISASVQAPPSQAVTNAGTFPTQSAITAASGSVASGAIASGAIASGAVASGAYVSGSVVDGAVVTLGANADAAVGDATGTVNAHVRQVAKLWSAVTFGDINNVAAATGLLNVIPAARYDSTQPTLTTGRWSSLQLSSRGELFVAPGTSGFAVSQSGSNWSINVAQINGVTPLMGTGLTGTGSPRTTEAQSNPVLLNGLTNSATTIVASAGTLTTLSCYNPNTVVSYVQVFDASSPSVGSTTPKLSYGIPALQAGHFTLRAAFATAIKAAATTTVNNGTAPSTALDCNATYE